MTAAASILVLLAHPEPLAEALERTGPERLLDEADLAHVQRFRHLRDRRLALASRALQRLALARAGGGIRAADLRFSRELHSRPEPTAPEAALGLRFSSANTAGLVACAVTRGAAPGIDVEPLRAEAPAELLDRCLSRRERAALEALPVARHAQRFVRLWTLKEAYLKARGIGLDVALDQFGFDLDNGDERPRLHADPALDPAPARWHFTCLPVGPAHLGALCLEIAKPAPPAIELRWFDWAQDGPRDPMAGE